MRIVTGGRTLRSNRAIALVVIAIVVLMLAAPARGTPLVTVGARGPAVRKLEVRVAGWYPRRGRHSMRIDKRFTSRTSLAVKTFQRHYGLTADGVVGPLTWAAIDRLQHDDGSTAHFTWKEFRQHRDKACSPHANRYAGTFRGGRVGPKFVRRFVIRVMWRLEALRAQSGGHEIVVVSGFRSRAYNRCMGGTSLSQHLFGSAADINIVHDSGNAEVSLAKRSHFEGVICYRTDGHTHLDLRKENRFLPAYRTWWWPKKRHGRYLADDHRVCRSE